MGKSDSRRYGKNLMAAALLWAIALMPLVSFGQTRISAPRNKYKVQDDVKLGQDASRQVQQQMPILNDSQSTQYLQQVGQRLVSAIPAEFQRPEFQYSFRIVNARDINAFALPGGPMYVNRGMIEAAQNEGEMAGVMAHEIAHVALRHATAQATQQSSGINQILGIGAVLGGAILGGQTGAAIGSTLYKGFLVNPYSRDYETQADILGSQMMARAGYDPRDLANMFRTIERTSGGGGPEFFSTHPSPENRYNKINQEASLLRVSPEPIKITQGFQRTKRYLQSLPQAPTMQQISQGGYGGTTTGGDTGSGTATGNYSSRVAYPSSQTRNLNLGVATVNVPANWESVNQSNTELWLAPSGAFGNQGITHGTVIGVTQGGGSLQQATNNYVQGILQANSYLRAQSNYSNANIGGRSGLAIALSGTSPVTNRAEITRIYTTQLRDGSLFYIVAVAPQSETSNYNYAFSRMLRSVQFNDR